MVGWHQQLNGHEFVQASEDGEGQGSLACCSPWDRKESDTTERLNNSRATGEADFHYIILFLCCLSRFLHCIASPPNEIISRSQVPYLFLCPSMPSPCCAQYIFAKLILWWVNNMGYLFWRADLEEVWGIPHRERAGKRMLFSQHPRKRGKRQQMLPEILDSSQSHSVATLEEAWVGWEIAMLSACALTVPKGWKNRYTATGGIGRAHRAHSLCFPGRWLPATLSGRRARLKCWEYLPGCFTALLGLKTGTFAAV